MRTKGLPIIYIVFLCLMVGCASKRTVRLTERHPNKEIKTYQVVSTYQVCRENCRIVKTKKKRIEYYETGKKRSIEKSVNEISLDGQYQSSKIHSKFFDEKGALSKKVKRDDLVGTVYVYENGKLKSK